MIRNNCSFRVYPNLEPSPVFLPARTNTQHHIWHHIWHHKEATLKRIVRKFLSDNSGATAIEYGLIAAGIALAIIAVVNGLGTNLNNVYTSINSSLK